MKRLIIGCAISLALVTAVNAAYLKYCEGYTLILGSSMDTCASAGGGSCTGVCVQDVEYGANCKWGGLECPTPGTGTRNFYTGTCNPSINCLCVLPGTAQRIVTFTTGC